MPYLTAQQVNQFFPVIGIIAYNGGVVVRRGCNLNLNRGNYLHERKKIFMVSKRSLAKLALLVRGTSVKFTSLMTLTYGANFPLSGRKAKKNLNHFLIASKRAFGAYEHVWCLEFQERGAVHFHIATTLPEPNELQREIFARLWADISTPHNWLYTSIEPPYGPKQSREALMTNDAVFWQHTRLQQWERVRKGDSLAHYFAKYTMKIRQKKVPSHYSDVGRFWAASQGVTLPDGEVFHSTEGEVKLLAGLYGRNMDKWEVLPRIILLG